MVYHHTQALDATFAALADPTRREILARLAFGEQSISALAAQFDMTLPGLSKHVYVLADAGLATIQRDGRVRRVRLDPAPMRNALEWIERYRRFWESELELLALYLEDPSNTESSCPPQPSRPRKRRPSSKSAARSARPNSASSTRGRNRKS